MTTEHWFFFVVGVALGMLWAEMFEPPGDAENE